MKKIQTLFLLFLVASTFGQTLENLKFDTNIFETTNQWIVLPKQKGDSIYTYGMVYIDIVAGITFHNGGSFYYDKNNKLINNKREDYQRIIQRLTSPTTLKAHVLNDNELNTLGLLKKPEWLEVYSFDETKIENQVKLGNLYNHVGACKVASNYLEKAYTINPHFEDLEFELSYSYNCLGEFKNAIPVLESAIKNDSKNSLFYKELGFAYVKNNQIDLAEKTYLKGIQISKNNFEKSEMAVNMTQGYFQIKNKKKYDEWAAKTRQFADKDNPFLPYLQYFEKNWDMKRE